MKTYYVFIFVLVIFACDKENIAHKNNADICKAVDFNDIGIYHNKGLDFVFEKLKASLETTVKARGDTSFKSEDEINCIINDAVREFSMQQTSDNLNNHSSPLKKIFNIYKLKVVDNSNLKAVNIDDFSKSLTTNQIKIFDELYNIIRNRSDDSTIMIRKVRALEDRAEDMLSEREQFIIFAATSVAKKSLQYWHNNIEKWNKLFGEKFLHKILVQKRTSLSKTNNSESGVHIIGIIIEDRTNFPILNSYVELKCKEGMARVRLHEGKFEFGCGYWNYPVQGSVFCNGHLLGQFYVDENSRYVNIRVKLKTWQDHVEEDIKWVGIAAGEASALIEGVSIFSGGTLAPVAGTSGFIIIGGTAILASANSYFDW